MQLDVGRLPQPQEGSQIVAHEVVPGPASMLGGKGHRLYETRYRATPVLLVEVLPVNAVRVAAHGQGPVTQLRQERRGYASQVDEQVPLGHRRRISLFRPEPLAEVGQRDTAPLYGYVKRIALTVELVQHAGHRARHAGVLPRMFRRPNAAGKSNLCDALDFLAEAYRLGLEIAVARKGGYENICYRHYRRSKAAISFRIRFQLESNEWRLPILSRSQRSMLAGRSTVFEHGFEIRTESQMIGAPFYVSKEHLEVCLKTSADDKQLQLPLMKGFCDEMPILTCSRTGDSITQLDAEGLNQLIGLEDFARYYLPRLSHRSTPSPYEKLPPTDLVLPLLEPLFWGLSPFRRTIGSLRVFQLSPGTCRQSGVPTPNPELGRFGSNLPAVVEYLKSNHRDRYSLLLDTVKRVMPTLRDLETEFTHTKTLVLFVSEVGFGRPWAAEDVSDGTIQTIALLAAAFDPRTSIVVVEEPENSVHPWALRNFMKGARHASDTKQVILTSHSPILIDQLRPHELWIVRRPHSETILSPAIELDPDLPAAWDQGRFTLSEYLDSGAIPDAVPREQP